MKKRVLYLLLALGILVLMSCKDAVTDAFLNNIPTEEHLNVFSAMGGEMQGVIDVVVEEVEGSVGAFDLTDNSVFTDEGIFVTGSVDEDGIISFSLELVDFSVLLINGTMSVEISLIGGSLGYVSESGELQFDLSGDRTVGFNLIAAISDSPLFIGIVTVDGISYNAALFVLAFYDFGDPKIAAD